MRRHRRTVTDKKGVFDPEDTQKVKHTKIGVWDLYEEQQPNVVVPGTGRLQKYAESVQGLPFFWRMIKDVLAIPSCLSLFVVYALVYVASSLVPALSLWYSGQLLGIVQTAVDKRTVDKRVLLEVAAGRFICSMLSRVFRYILTRVSAPLNSRIRRFYATHTFHALARLDVPTFDDASVQKQLEQSVSLNSRSTVAWDSIMILIGIGGVGVQIVSQLLVLANVLRAQEDGPLLAGLTFIRTAVSWRSMGGHLMGIDPLIWAATTKNTDYVRMQGLKKLVSSSNHRKEIVAGGLWPYLLSLFRDCTEIVGDESGDFHEMFQHNRRQGMSFLSLLDEPLAELPQIIFTLRAVKSPASIPLSLASLNLITQTSHRFTNTLFNLFDKAGVITERLTSVRQLYQVTEIPNVVVDGQDTFPEDEQAVKSGIAVEFKNVSFKYPDTESYALRDVSFKIGKGQLFVALGENGGGKSTLLKLIARIYDPTEGTIFVDGRDIKTYKLQDLRRATAVLFQDYTHFPLSIRDNIGLGDPDNITNEEHIIQAAKLGGADGFVSKLPEGYDTYLERPVIDYYSSLPEGTTTLFGRPVSYSGVRRAGGMTKTATSSLSGGQLQRIALSRTFMRSVVGDERVGLLLFDEPSASLDPKAEHDLFERLRTLRGNKTMIFSSHRFGNLTRHADRILYMHDGMILEDGTHKELLERDGEYSRLWMLQAQQFLP